MMMTMNDDDDDDGRRRCLLSFSARTTIRWSMELRAVLISQKLIYVGTPQTSHVQMHTEFLWSAY